MMLVKGLMPVLVERVLVAVANFVSRRFKLEPHSDVVEVNEDKPMRIIGYL